MNDNAPDAGRARPAAPIPAGLVRIVGFVGEGGRVTLTDPTWRPTPAGARPGPVLQLVDTDGPKEP